MSSHKKILYKRGKVFFATLLLTTAIGCSLGDPIGGVSQQTLSRPLSLSDPNFRTCVFDPGYSIVHFPMHHFPSDGHYTQEDYELVARSQFQLFHTILNYNRSQWDISLFEESVITDTYNEDYLRSLQSGQRNGDQYTRIDGRSFQIAERLQTANNLFQNGIPGYYEHLTPPQKQFLFDMGASFTLYLIGEIPRIHKVISYNQFQVAKNNLRDITGQMRVAGNSYWIFDFREEELRKEVLSFYRQYYHPRKIFFIAYGTAHSFVEEFAGLPFQSGHELCLMWEKK